MPAPCRSGACTGFRAGTSDADVIARALANAKRASTRAAHVGITYDDMVALLQTRFVNPNSDLIPKLERLGVPFATLKKLKDGHDHGRRRVRRAAADRRRCARPGRLRRRHQGVGEERRELRAHHGDDHADRPVRRAPTRAASTASSFATRGRWRAPRHLDPARRGRVRPPAALHPRCGRRLAWTIEQTDAAICALFRATGVSADRPTTSTRSPKLDAGFLALLPRLGVVVRVMKALNLNAEARSAAAARLLVADRHARRPARSTGRCS